MTIAGRSASQDKGLEARLAQLQRTAKARAAALADCNAAGAPETARDVRSAPGPARAGTGRSNRVLVAAATHTLETFVQQRGLEQTELCPTSEYPTP